MLTEQQLEKRKSGIGASEAAAVLGLNKYRTPLQVWLEKTGRATEDPAKFGPGTPAYWGNLIESAIADTYAAKHNVKLRKCGTLVHPDHSFIMATPDREIVGERKLLECKASSPWRDDFGEAGTDEVPQEYVIQCHQQMAVRGWTEHGCDLALFQTITNYREYHIEFDGELWEMCVKRLTAFWDLVNSDEQPEMTTLADLDLLHPIDMGGSLLADSELIELHVDVLQAKAVHKDITSQKKLLEDKLKLMIAGNSQLVNEDNKVLATYKAAKETFKVDYKAALDELVEANGLQAECEELIEKHTATKPGSRRLLVKENL